MYRYLIGEKEIVVIDGKVFIEAPPVTTEEKSFENSLISIPKDLPKQARLPVLQKNAEKPAIPDTTIAEMVTKINNGEDLKLVCKSHEISKYLFMKQVVSGGHKLIERRGRKKKGLQMNKLHCTECDYDWETAMTIDDMTCPMCYGDKLTTI